MVKKMNRLSGFHCHCHGTRCLNKLLPNVLVNRTSVVSEKVYPDCLVLVGRRNVFKIQIELKLIKCLLINIFIDL